MGRAAPLFLLALLSASCGGEASPAAAPEAANMTEPDPVVLDADLAGRLIAVVLDWAPREYPHHLYVVVNGDDELVPPREMHPAFHGCLDWHSAVHMHWAMVRFLRDFPDHVRAAEARELLDRHLTPERIAGEVAFFTRPHHLALERPYGWAWLLLLMRELMASPEPNAGRWAGAVRPLAGLLATRSAAWLATTHGPNRTGLHGNTAFALALMLDYAAAPGAGELETAARAAARRFYGSDGAWPAWIEPMGPDFLSPGLAEADLMRRVLPPGEFREWLDRFLPGLGSDPASPLFRPVEVADREDPWEGHLVGLSFHRAAAMRGIAGSFAAADPRRAVLLRAADRHVRAGLAQLEGSGWGGEHWLPTFAFLALSENR